MQEGYATPTECESKKENLFLSKFLQLMMLRFLRGILKESDANPKKKLKPCPDVRPTVVSTCSKKNQALSWKSNAANQKHVT